MAIEGSVVLVVFVMLVFLMFFGVIIAIVCAAAAWYQMQETSRDDLHDNASKRQPFQSERPEVHHSFHFNQHPSNLHQIHSNRDVSFIAPSTHRRGPVIEEIQEPNPTMGNPSKSVMLEEPRKNPMEYSKISVVDKEALQKGYARELASRFGNSVAFHGSNVVAIVNAYGLDADDICYCFLCLERVMGTKKGDYSARVWTTVFARFVFHVQGMHNATDSDHLRLPCSEWQYQHNDFLNEVAKVERALNEKHGDMLWSAFHKDDVREAELARARVTLCGAKVAEAVASKASTCATKKPLALEDSLTASASRKRLRRE